MSQCMDLIAAMSQPSAECVLRCVSLIALNCFVNLPWSSIAERDSASEGLVSHMRKASHWLTSTMPRCKATPEAKARMQAGKPSENFSEGIELADKHDYNTGGRA